MQISDSELFRRAAQRRHLANNIKPHTGCSCDDRRRDNSWQLAVQERIIGRSLLPNNLQQLRSSTGHNSTPFPITRSFSATRAELMKCGALSKIFCRATQIRISDSDVLTDHVTTFATLPVLLGPRCVLMRDV